MDSSIRSSCKGAEIMNDIVIVPSYYRPEFLALCLEHLASAVGGKQKRVFVYQDRHIGDNSEMVNTLLPEVREVCRRMEKSFDEFHYIERHPVIYRGNPSNFLEAYNSAFLETDSEFVFLVEDDVMVCRDFFQWHYAIQDELNPFISVGWHCIRETAKVPTTNDPNAYVTSYRDFSSIGICWKRENLSVLVQHAKPAYYSNMSTYIKNAFPNSPIHFKEWTEQAGIITRLLHEKPGERLVVWAGLSRVGHIGIRGYHRQNGFKFTGSLDEKIQALKNVYLNPQKLLELYKDRWDDINVPTIIPSWDSNNFYCLQHNPYVRGIV